MVTSEAASASPRLLPPSGKLRGRVGRPSRLRVDRLEFRAYVRTFLGLGFDGVSIWQSLYSSLWFLNPASTWAERLGGGGVVVVSWWSLGVFSWGCLVFARFCALLAVIVVAVWVSVVVMEVLWVVKKVQECFP